VEDNGEQDCPQDCQHIDRLKERWSIMIPVVNRQQGTLALSTQAMLKGGSSVVGGQAVYLKSS
jgi:hypothetical protein